MNTRLRRWLDALTHTGPGYQLCPLPRRGDPVEQWLKAQRDTSTDWSDWYALDAALDRYRLHADTGTPLGQHACDGPHCCDNNPEAQR